MNPKTAALNAKTNPVYTGTSSFGKLSQMNSQQRAGLRALGARLVKKPILQGQNLPNGGWGPDTKPAKGLPRVKGSPSLDSQ